MGLLKTRREKSEGTHVSLEGVQLPPPRAQQSEARPDDSVRGAHRQEQLLALLEQRLQRQEGSLGAESPVSIKETRSTRQSGGKTTKRCVGC